MSILTATMVIVFVLAALFGISWIIIKKRIGESDRFDERQVAAQGRAYTTAYFFLVVWMVLAVLLNGIGGGAFLGGMESMSYLGVVISVDLAVNICILEDAYLELRRHAKAIMGYLALMAAWDLWRAFSADVTVLPEFDMMNGIWMNLVLGMSFLFTALVLLIQQWLDNRENANG